MVPLNVDVATPLKNLIAAHTGSLRIYVNDGIPTTDFGAEFISIDMNGGIASDVTKRGCSRCALAVSLYVKLLTTGAVNTRREEFLLGQFQSVFSDIAKTTDQDLGVSFSYELANTPYIYSGKSLITGYSTKVLNVNCFINY